MSVTSAAGVKVKYSSSTKAILEKMKELELAISLASYRDEEEKKMLEAELDRLKQKLRT